MVKKVFAIIGIVLGSVTAFVGAVVGVMALMGKFKTPIVYPERLTFVESEQTIINDNQDRLYSFVLNGYSSSEYEVNQKNCFIDILDGTDLIEFCDANGKALTQVENKPNRYAIKCNEQTYFRLQEIDASHFEDGTFGKIVLQARDEKGKIQSNQLTIWVDRAVKEIYIGDIINDEIISAGEIEKDGNIIVQTISLGVDVKEYISYVTTPKYALNPMSKCDAKIVELYYFDGLNYVLINNENIDNYNFIYSEAETGKIYFESAEAGSFTFKVAVFDTYASRESYLSDASHLSDTNFERINNMVSTTVTFNVINSDIDNIGLNSTGLIFDLYKDTSMTLSSADVNTVNNLGLYMTKDGRVTYARFNEVDFTLNNENNWATSNIVYSSSDGDKTLTLLQTNQKVKLTGFEGFDLNSEYDYYFSDNQMLIDGRLAFNINTSNKVLGQKTSISNLTCLLGDNTIELKSKSGVSFIEPTGATFIISLLTAGSYLEFYKFDETTGIYTACDNNMMDYSIKSIVGSGREKTFNLVIKNIPELEETESLVLGIMVINGTGDNYFAHVNVIVKSQELVFSWVKDSSITLGVNYEKDGNNYVTNYDSLNFDEIINIEAGSYNACVFITPKSDSYDIEVLEGVTFIDSDEKEYVLVGTFVGGKYRNVVKVRENATNLGSKLYVMQLKNAYGESSEDYINNILYSENVIAQYDIILNLDENTSETAKLNLKFELNNGAIQINKELSNLSSISASNISIQNAEIQSDKIVVVLSNGQELQLLNNGKFIIPSQIEGGENKDVLLADKSNAENIGYAEVVNAYILSSRAVTISVVYSIIESEIVFYYNEKTELGGDNYITKNENGNVSIVENTASHVLIISAPNVSGMIKNMFNANFNISSNLFVHLYDENGNLLNENYIGGMSVVSATLNENETGLAIVYNINNSLAKPNYYLKLCLSYDGVMVESAPIYIESTAPTDIKLVYTTTDGDSTENHIVDLSATAPSIENDLTGFYLRVEVSFSSIYDYTYYLVLNDGSKVEINEDFFNSSSEKGNISNGFNVLPEYEGITQNINYYSLDESILTFGGTTPNILSVGKTVIQIQAGGISRYIAVEIVDPDRLFTLSQKQNPLEITGVGSTLSSLIDYTYNNNSIIGNEGVNLSIQNIKVVDYGGGQELEVVPNDTETGYNVQTKVASSEDSEVVLEIVRDGRDWKFTRKSHLTVNLSLSFSVITITNKLNNVRVTFTSSISINQNSNWSNYYQGTSVLLFEISENDNFENNAVFKIKSNSDISVEVSDPAGNKATLTSKTSGEGAVNNILELSSLGTYTVLFKSGGETVETLSFTVVPNYVVISGEQTEFNMNSAYNISNLITLKQYKTTGIIYGLDGMYGDVDGENPKYLENVTSYPSGLTVSSNLSNTLFKLLEPKVEDGSLTYTIQSGWIETLGAGQTETLTIKIDNNKIGEVTATVKNNVVYSLNDYNYSYDDDNGNKINVYKAETERTFVDIIVGGTTFKLSSIMYTPKTDVQFGVEYLPNEKKFRFVTYGTTQIEPISNVILKFTFVSSSEGDDRQLIFYTTEADHITITPYVPNENETIPTAFSNNEYDLLNDIYNITGIENSVITSFVVKNVSDASAFASIDFGAGYTEGSENNAVTVRFNDFEGAEKIVGITYKVTYVVGGQTYTYTFTRDITIKNRLSITTVYPFNDLSDSRVNCYFNSMVDGENNGTFVSTGTYYTYAVTTFNYEPVMIGQTLNLGYNEIANMTRAFVVDEITSNIVENGGYEIEIAGWEARSTITNYVNSSSIVIDSSNKTITFNASSTFSNGSYGFILFKLTTESGFMAYYGVQLYNQNGTYPTASSTTQVSKQTDSSVVCIDIENGKVLGQSLTSYLDADNNPISYTETDLSKLQFTTNDFKNLSFYILSANMLDGTDFFTAHNVTRYSKLTSDTTLPELTNYTHIKIGVVLQAGTTSRSLINVGVINFYVQPKYNEVVKTIGEGDNKVDVLDKLIKGMYSGEYIKTITINEDIISNPFEKLVLRSDNSDTSASVNLTILETGLSTGYTIDNNQILMNSQVVVELSGEDISLKQNVQDDLKFSAKYTYTIDSDTFVLIVHYTYKKLDISNDTVTLNNIGSYDNGVFNNRVDLTQIVGQYNKTITINEKEINLADGSIDEIALDGEGYNNVIFEKDTDLGIGEIRYKFESGKSYLEFELLNKAYTKEFIVTINKIANGKMDKTIYANVLSGIYASFPVGSDGTSQLSPLKSTLNYSDEAELYSTSDASSISITGTNVTDENGNLIYRIYTIGDLSIITSAGSIIELEFNSSDVNYVNTNLSTIGTGINKKYTYSFDWGEETTSATNTINFVHTAKAKDIEITIRIKDGDNYYIEGDNAKTISLFVQIIESYYGLQANYLVAGAGYENVARNSKIHNLVSDLLVNGNSTVIDVSSSTKILNASKISLIVDNKTGKTRDLSESEISAIGFNVPNNPNELVFNAGNLMTIGSDNKLTFANTTVDGSGTLLIANDAGVNVSYTYHVLAYDDINGINSSIDTAGVVTITNGETKTNTYYSTLLVNDKGEGTQTNDNGEYIVLAETELGAIKDGQSTAFYISRVIEDITVNIPGSLTKSISKVSDETNGTIYTFTYTAEENKYYTLTLRVGTNNRLYISMIRYGLNPFEKADITVTMYSTGGLIAENYKIMLYNYVIKSNYESSYKSVYATSHIDLANDITFTSNIKGGSSLSFSNAEIDLNDSYYDLNGKQYITSLNNAIFDYDKDNNLIKTKAVGQDINVTLILRVTDGNGFIVKILKYNFTLKVHFEFTVNGESLPSGNSAFNTKYMLTTDSSTLTTDADNNLLFPYTINYEDSSNYNASYNDTSYNTALNLALVDKVNGSQINLNNVDISEISNFGVVIDKANRTITLDKDITGTIILKLSIDTGNGIYSINWNIEVRGFIDLEYRSSAGSNTILTQQSGEAFTSNATVNLADKSATTNGLYMSNTNGVGYSENGTNNNSIGDVTPTVNYIILPFSEYQYNFDAQNLFKQAKDSISANASLDFGRNKISVTLPRVEQSESSARTYYLVVYKIKLTYLGQTTQDYYVTYKVHNEQKVTVASSDNLVNVETSDFIYSGTYLDLFYYKETYKTTDNNTFEVYLDKDKNIVMEFNEANYIKNNDGYFVDKNNDKNYYYISNEAIEYYQDETNNKTYTIDKKERDYSSLFACDYANIEDFKAFISDVNKIQFTNITGLARESNSVELDLVHTHDGYFGVQLYNASETDDSKKAPLKFNNQLTANLNVVMTSGQTEISVPAHDGSIGFGLVSSSKLQANTTDITLGSVFLRDELTSTAGGFTISDNMSEKIIGVGTPDSSWINLNGSSIIIPGSGIVHNDTNLATFKVADGSAGTSYYLRQVTYTSSEANLYNLKETSYYITAQSGKAEIVKMDYSSSIQSYFYQVNPTYTAGTDAEGNPIIYYEDSVLNLNGLVKVYSMQTAEETRLTSLTQTNKTPTVSEITVGDYYENDNALYTSQSDGKYTTISNGNIVMVKDTLTLLQNKGISSISLKFNATYNEYTLRFTVEFKIPVTGTLPKGNSEAGT